MNQALPAPGLAWGTISQASLVELIELAARYGFPTIQIAPHLYKSSLEAGLEPKVLRKRLKDAGVRVTVIDGISAGLPGLPEGPMAFRGTTMERFDAPTCIEIAEALDAPFVNLAPYLGEAVPLQAMADTIGGTCRLAARSCAGIVIEFMPDSGIPGIAEAVAMVEAVGEPNLKLLLDTWHLARGSGTVADIRKVPDGMIGACQFSDRIEPPPGAPYVPMTGRMLPGEGELALFEMLGAACQANPGLTPELEVFSDELLALPAAAAAQRIASAVARWLDPVGQSGA